MAGTRAANTSHSDWYDSFYSDERIAGYTGPWYIGVDTLMRRLVPKGSSDARILEIGCGGGRFLSRVGAGFSVGIDPSINACMEAARNGVRSSVALGENIPLAGKSVDVVICCEVIEHVITPIKVVAEAHRVLREDGLLFISFPNYLNLGWLMLRVASEVMRKPGWVIRQPVDRYLTYWGIVLLLRKVGFRPIESVGVVIEPPGLYHWRSRRGLPELFTRRLAWLSYHPVIAARRISP